MEGYLYQETILCPDCKGERTVKEPEFNDDFFSVCKIQPCWKCCGFGLVEVYHKAKGI
jgi:hypothetical protein